MPPVVVVVGDNALLLVFVVINGDIYVDPPLVPKL
jgi:hypothetical protein